MDIEDQNSNRRRKRNDDDNENNSIDDDNENEIKKVRTSTGEVGDDANPTNTTTDSGGDSNLLQSINGELIVYDFVKL